MSDFTDHLETMIRDWMSQGTAFNSAPGTLYIGLHTSDPTDSPDGTTEVGADDYSRASVTTGSGFDTSLNPTEFTNANDVSFGEATNNWGTIEHVSLHTSTIGGGGNWLATIALSSSKTIDSGDEAVFPAGSLTFEVA